VRLLVVALLCGSMAFPAQARRSEAVTFPSLDRDAAGAAVQLQAVLLLPPGSAPPPGRPAIVALHGCGGMYSRQAGREGQLAERMALRADPLLHDGYAVLFVDSFRSRGLREVCTIRIGERTIKADTRRLDALTSLASRKDVARDRIALVYRGCASPLAAGEHYRPGAPTLAHRQDRASTRRAQWRTSGAGRARRSESCCPRSGERERARVPARAAAPLMASVKRKA
jgi:hypothetical protein